MHKIATFGMIYNQTHYIWIKIRLITAYIVTLIGLQVFSMMTRIFPHHPGAGSKFRESGVILRDSRQVKADHSHRFASRATTGAPMMTIMMRTR